MTEITSTASGRPEDPDAHAALVRENARLREVVLQHEQAATTGALSAGLLHDMINALTSTLGLEALARASTAGEVPQILGGIRDETWRAVGLARELLRLARALPPHDRARTSTDVDAVVRRLCKAFARLCAGSGTRFELACEADDGHVRIDPLELGRVVANLLSNARDALGTRNPGGTLRVATRRIELAPGRAAKLRLPSGEFVEISVQDSGRGLSSREMERVFEPFYTTKSATGGTGLGLPVVHEIVRRSKGAIDLTSDPGRGTRIDVLLPVCAIEMSSPDGSAEDPSPAVGFSHRTLVLESDPRRRATLAAVLQSRGHVVDAMDPELFALVARSPDVVHPWTLVLDEDAGTRRGGEAHDSARHVSTTARGQEGQASPRDLEEILAECEGSAAQEPSASRSGHDSPS